MSEIQKRLGEQVVVMAPDTDVITKLVIDSRNILYPSQSLFFAIKGQLQDGHHFIGDAYQQGVRNFVVSDEKAVKVYNDINYCLVADVTAFLQSIAIQHRAGFPDLTVVGITGSNGKTVVKEWLSYLLSRVYATVKTPKSYNSQIGVALSVWGISAEHQMAVFEAGISKVGEMDKLQKMIRPSLGILTNIGDAHDNGFENRGEKLQEKLSLFAHSQCLVYNGDDLMIHQAASTAVYKGELCNWGYEMHNAVRLQRSPSDGIDLVWQGKELHFDLQDQSSIFFENAMHCICSALWLKVPVSIIEDSLASWQGLDMRLQLTLGKNDCLVVNDSYTNDLQALAAALDFTEKHKGHRESVVILSEMEHAIDHPTSEILALVQKAKVDELWLVGSLWQHTDLPEYARVFLDTNALLDHLQQQEPSSSIVLIKGARRFAFEKVYAFMISQSHSVSLDIDLAAIEHNLSTYGSMLQSGTRLMPIIKASAYGAGSEEIAKLLEHKGVYALGVAFADEGAQLRRAGITLPIAVLNADTQSFQTLLDNRLDLEIYSLNQLQDFVNYRQGKLLPLGIHLKLDTGMSRLGFREEDMPALLDILQQFKLNIISVFSHLSSSEDEGDDGFSHLQAQRFLMRYDQISEALAYQPKRHLLNSAGIVRFPEYHFDMVRLGLGLYGIDSSGVAQDRLEKVHTLKARIIQIKKLLPGDYVGYNRRHKVEQPTTIGVLNIGYADGFMRRCGNHRYQVLVNGHKVPVIGNVCMDLSMIDLTQAGSVAEGDEVILFGKDLPIEDMATACDTIPYEILCRIAPRIQRRYTQ
ncbi:MAG: bifunctional UDP-N-acetylmuramoyl-tripeptide:D-alanyl-D-alanine ligase/alanine racemase [Saprospiraceae bacterium]|nr:bifunctional UDP-N-acetylmuramoyl-tripeptide:D-alanyl-D-alanine ligase/alanine racemase [Saprospiraceae bacterium]